MSRVRPFWAQAAAADCLRGQIACIERRTYMGIIGLLVVIVLVILLLRLL